MDPRKSNGGGTIPPESLDPAVEVGVCGEDRSKEAQEDEGGQASTKAKADA